LSIAVPPWRVLTCLLIPPVMWSANAVVGRLMVGVVPPATLNALRWALVAVLLLPLAARAVRQPADWLSRWRHLIVLGALGVGSYNLLQYLALHTASPINVTLIAATSPVWMMLVGWLRHAQALHARQALGAVASLAGVATVMSQGRMDTLTHWQWVPGDLYMLLASLAWAIYSWMLARPPAHLRGAARPDWNWADFLWVQVMYGLLWAVLAAGVEQAHVPDGAGWVWLRDPWAWLAIVFIALGPSLWAYRCWGLAVQAVGPTRAAFFANLTPLFAAMWSLMLLGEGPAWYHPVALGLIAAGIALSSRREGAADKQVDKRGGDQAAGPP
jgi:drug/metabolite transporter (DMT)-like permease